MKPVTTIAAIIFTFVALMQLVRLLFKWEVTVDGLVIPLWASAIACAFAAALAFMLWREARR